MHIAGSRYPFVVVRLMSAMYQREDIAVHSGAPAAHIGHRDSYVHHPTPFSDDGSISEGCRAVLIAACLGAVKRTRLRMCIVWNAGSCTFLELDGSVRDSVDAPKGGFGTQGEDQNVPGADIAFDDLGPVKGWHREQI